MTAQPLRLPRQRQGLRVIAGRRARRLPLAPWVVFSLVAVLLFLGMVLTRTSLDRAAIEQTSVQRAIAEAKSANQRLRLEIGRLESPARIAPLAESMGMVYPEASKQLLVAGVIADPGRDPRWAELARLSMSAGGQFTAAAGETPAGEGP